VFVDGLEFMRQVDAPEHQLHSVTRNLLPSFIQIAKFQPDLYVSCMSFVYACVCACVCISVGSEFVCVFACVCLLLQRYACVAASASVGGC